jgi:uncharacterized C2H2 Zn-finger protein
MVHRCNECDSSFREKKNLKQHMKKQHGLKKYKCGYCNDRFDNRMSMSRHEKTKHENELFKCKQCEYASPTKDKLRHHIRSKHLEKNLKCDQCDFVTDTNHALKKHVNAMHVVKTCNECEFKTKSLREMKKHKDTQHQPDDYYEYSAFKKLFYDKTWRVRGVIDPLSALQIYQPKIKNTIQHYLNEKGAMKWYIGMKVIMKKMDYSDGGKQIAQIDPGFTSNPNITLMMFNFDDGYSTAREKIEKDFLEFLRNGSGWIFDRVDLVSLHIAGYQPVRLNQREQEEMDNDDREAERMHDDV